MPLNTKIVLKWIARDCDSMADAARRLDVHRPNLIRLVRSDDADVMLSTLERLADVIGCEPADLIRRR